MRFFHHIREVYKRKDVLTKCNEMCRKSRKVRGKTENIRLKKAKSFLEKRIFASGTKLGGFIALKGMRGIRKYGTIDL